MIKAVYPELTFDDSKFPAFSGKLRRGEGRGERGEGRGREGRGERGRGDNSNTNLNYNSESLAQHKQQKEILCGVCSGTQL